MTISSPGSSRARHMSRMQPVQARARQHLGRVQPEPPGERVAQRPGPGVGVEAHARGGVAHRRERRRHRREGPLVRGELDHRVQAHLAADVVDGAAGLVGVDAREGRPQQGGRERRVDAHGRRLYPPPATRVARVPHPEVSPMMITERSKSVIPFRPADAAARRRGLLLPRPDRLAQRRPHRDGRPRRLQLRLLRERVRRAGDRRPLDLRAATR